MRAIDMFMDLMEIILDTLLIIFFIYIVIYKRDMDLVKAIVGVIAPIAIFAALFMGKIKRAKDEYRFVDRKAGLDEIVFYITNKDIRTDEVMIAVSAGMIYLLAAIFSDIGLGDLLQIIFFLIVMMPWHYYFFIKKNEEFGYAAITRLKMLNDEIIIFLIPLYLLLPAFMVNQIETIDVSQMFVPFFLMYAWRRILYSRSNKI